jgi:hypothetical protein
MIAVGDRVGGGKRMSFNFETTDLASPAEALATINQS